MCMTQEKVAKTVQGCSKSHVRTPNWLRHLQTRQRGDEQRGCLPTPCNPCMHIATGQLHPRRSHTKRGASQAAVRTCALRSFSLKSAIMVASMKSLYRILVAWLTLHRNSRALSWGWVGTGCGACMQGARGVENGCGQAGEGQGGVDCQHCVLLPKSAVHDTCPETRGIHGDATGRRPTPCCREEAMIPATHLRHDTQWVVRGNVQVVQHGVDEVLLGRVLHPATLLPEHLPLTGDRRRVGGYSPEGTLHSHECTQFVVLIGIHPCRFSG